MAKIADKYYKGDAWNIVEEGLSKERNEVSESIFSLANEYMGIRGYADEGSSLDSLKGSYFNGIYEIDNNVQKSYKGIVTKTHFMVSAVNWIDTKIVADGELLDLNTVSFKDFSRRLSMKEGMLYRSFTWITKKSKEITLSFERFLSMDNGEASYQRIKLNSDKRAEINITFSSDFDAKHMSYNNKCFWNVIDKGDDYIVGQTLTSNQRLVSAFSVENNIGEKSKNISSDMKVGKEFNFILEANLDVVFTRNVIHVVEKNKEVNVSKIIDDANAKLRKIDSYDFAIEKQRTYWKNYFENMDVEIEKEDGDDEDQQGIRFSIFQLAQTFHGGQMGHNVGAKGLSGEFYNGHAFWDTETYCFPFYLFSNPEAAKYLLEFRYETLDGARNRAKEVDMKGAYYPLATLNGDEGCTLWQHANLQFMATTGVSFGVWHYLNITDDWEFVVNYGAEMVFEIARYLSARGGYGSGKLEGKFGFFGVMGPDEFHMMINNDSYTNYLGKEAFLFAIEVATRMKTEYFKEYERLSKKISLDEKEILSWEKYANDMHIPMTKEGLFEEFDGYFEFPYIDVDKIPVEEFPLYHNWSYDRIYRTSMIKQPAVLMFIFMYSSRFSKEEKMVNYKYYEPRTIHESSLSPSVHSILAAELDIWDDAMKFFSYATRLDLDNYNRNTNEGLHITSLAASWINIVYGFSGFKSDGKLPSFEPKLPPKWKSYRYRMLYRGNTISVEINKDFAIFSILKGNGAQILVNGEEYFLSIENQIKVKI